MLWLIAMAASAALVAWLVSAPQGDSSAVRAGVAGTVIVVVMLTTSLLRQARGRLRFTGAEWLWEPHGVTAGSGEAIAGRLEVQLDLGSFMLLRFVPRPFGRRRPRACWMAVGTRSATGGWHALRCAAYAPLPAADRIGAATANPS